MHLCDIFLRYKAINNCGNRITALLNSDYTLSETLHNTFCDFKHHCLKIFTFLGRQDTKLSLSLFHLISLVFPVSSKMSTNPHSQLTYCIMWTLKQEFKDLWIRWVVLTGATVAILGGQPTRIMCRLFPLASEVSERETERERGISFLDKNITTNPENTDFSL